MNVASSGSTLDFGQFFTSKPVSYEINVDNCLSEARAPARGCQPCPETAAAETATLRYRRTERTALYIETQEGDVVRLRIKVRDSVNAAAQQGGDAEATELAVGAHSSVKLRFSVEGNLSAEELAAIEDVVAQAAELAEDFFAGDLPAAFATAAALELDGDTLARVGLRLSVREHLTYSGTAVYRASPPAPAPEPTASLPGPAPVAEAPAPVASAPETAAAVNDSTSPPAGPGEPAVDDAPAATMPPHVTVAANALATIAEFIGQLLDSLAAPPTDGESSKASIDVSLRLRIFQAVVVNVAAIASPGTNETTPAATLPLVADTLDALVAQQQGLDTHA